LTAAALRLAQRLLWAVVCLAVWPVYYAILAVRFVVPLGGGASSAKLHAASRHPPFVEKLRDDRA
jgi:hypothetical protein